MIVRLYKNSSENNCIGKQLELINTINCTLKQNCSFLYPVLLFETSEDINNINYIYIEEFNRYYFINELKTIVGNRYEIRATVDVLESFKSNILDLKCIINATENIGKDNYLSSESWVNKVKDTTTILNFQNGLLEDGEFILITAGG